MYQCCQLLTSLTSLKGRKDKETLIKENDSPELRFLLETAFNPYLTYGIKEFTNVVTRTEIPTLEELEHTRRLLATRQVTGHDAMALLQKTIGVEDEETRKCLYKVFVKELRIGMEVKSINKIFDGFIPTFDIGLCEEFKEESNYLPVGQWAIEPKYDGLRCVVIIDNEGTIIFYSRTGKQMWNVDYVLNDLRKLGLRGVVLDGEIYAQDWHLTVSVTHTQTDHKDKKELKYHIFDAMSLEDWFKKESTMSYAARKDFIKSLFPDEYDNIVVAPHTVVSSYETAMENYTELLEQGYEGAVLKEMNTPYPFGRSKGWAKWKPFYTHDLTITGYEEGTGRNESRLGAFICQFNGEEVKVGNGYDDDMRESFWANRDSMIGTVIEVKGQEVTKDGKLRFPVYMRNRTDK